MHKLPETSVAFAESATETEWRKHVEMLSNRTPFLMSDVLAMRDRLEENARRQK